MSMDLEMEWNTELDRLEIELLWAERLLKVAEPLDRTGWFPPEPRGPLPAHLWERAHAIVERQTELRLQLVQQLQVLARERAFTTVASADAPTPRYLDSVG